MSDSRSSSDVVSDPVPKLRRRVCEKDDCDDADKSDSQPAIHSQWLKEIEKELEESENSMVSETSTTDLTQVTTDNNDEENGGLGFSSEEEKAQLPIPADEKENGSHLPVDGNQPSDLTVESEGGGSNNTNTEEVDGSGGVAAFTILGIFILSIIAMIFVYTNFPEFDETEKKHLKFPTSMDDAKILGDILFRYKDKYFYEVLSGVCVSYIFLQTFAIPGSIFLSIMSGFLFSFPVALTLICFCSATGASFCYLLSFLIGRRLVYKYFPERAQAWSATVNKHKNNLLNYIIFLRITPLIPNWFINITAPVLDVPLLPFWLGTFIGVGPPSIVAIQAGTTLHELTSTNDAVSWTSLIILLVVGVLSLIPVLLKDVLKSQFD